MRWRTRGFSLCFIDPQDWVKPKIFRNDRFTYCNLLQQQQQQQSLLAFPFNIGIATLK